jgi:hypothetical protein
MTQPTSAFQPVVERIITAIESGIEPQRLAAYMRDCGWFEVNGQELSDSSFAGLVAIATHQMTMQGANPRQTFRDRKDEIYSLSRSVAFSALMAGDLKNANAAIANMRDTAVAERVTPAPKAKPGRQASIPEISLEEIERITHQSGSESR